MTEELYISFTFAAWAFLLCQVLTDARHFLSWLPNFANKLASGGEHKAGVKWKKNLLQQAVVNWLGGCSVCVAGLTAIFIYPFWLRQLWDLSFSELWGMYPFLVHGSVVVISMFLAEVFDRLLD